LSTSSQHLPNNCDDVSTNPDEVNYNRHIPPDHLTAVQILPKTVSKWAITVHTGVLPEVEFAHQHRPFRGGLHLQGDECPRLMVRAIAGIDDL